MSRPDPDPSDRLIRLIPTEFQPELMLPLVGDRFRYLRPNVGETSGGFSPPKPNPPDLTDVIYKFGQLWQDQAQIQGDPARSQLYLVRFSQIRPNPSRFSAILVYILAISMLIWWVFADFSHFFANSSDICSLQQHSPPTEPTRAPPELKIDN